MKGFILLTDAARAHPDGTFSLLRGGIDRVHGPAGKPLPFQGSLVARISGTLSEAGDHSFKLRVLSEDGRSVAPDVSGSFRIPEGGGATVAVINFSIVLPGFGRYTFALLVDQLELDVWELRAVESQGGTAPGGKG